MSEQTPPAEVATRLSRRVGVRDAVVIGLGSMVGAGVFVAIGPAARAAGNALWLGLLVAAVVAYCNATSSAQLAALHPQSGGTYVYGRERLGGFWGFLAGFGFTAGKLASCAAMALTFANYAAPQWARPLAIGAVVALTTLNLFGIQKSVGATRAIVALVILSLAVVLVSLFTGSSLDASRLWPFEGASVRGVMQAAGFLFFAFAGYARLATLGEEVIDPRRTIPRAIPIALGIALVIYVLVALAALLAVPTAELGRAPAPLVAALEAAGRSSLAPVVRAGAVVASLGVLLSLLLGLSRTIFAMASNGDMPRLFAVVDERHKVPRRAEIAVGAVVVAALMAADLRTSIGFSSFAVLIYYAITNAAALTLEPGERRWPRWIAVLGLVGCAAIALSLPLESVIAGAAMLIVGALSWRVAKR
ncbi:MAG: amino acid permease [Polyangiaceae bacterium]|nr:amino acid permease [Polyangiaceae bacterium]